MNQKDNMVASITIEVRRDEKEGLYSDVDMVGETQPLIVAMIEALSGLLKQSMKDGVTEDEISDVVRDILRDLLKEE